jgi:protein involved in polysaccharide export with SLBB domain
MSVVGTVWSPIGPSPMSEGSRPDNGLVSAIAVNPNDPHVIYQGTAGGGVWLSKDGGTTWQPQFDHQVSMGIGEPGALAIDPNNTDVLYIGTSGRVTQQIQGGLFKSTDGGASCVAVGSGYPADNIGNATQFVNQDINVIIVDPANSSSLYLASSFGAFYSADGGLNWTQGTGFTGDTRAFVLDVSSPASSRVLWAGVAGQGVFRSADGGATWTQLLSASTPAVASAVGSGSIGKFVVALAPPTSPPHAGGVQVAYASMTGFGSGTPDPVGFFVSKDGGATWTRQAATGMPTNTQGGYSFHFAVDPASPGDGVHDIIYFGCVGQAKSTNSGASFTGMTGMHADTHSWAFVPQPSPAPSVVYCGNDGGIFCSTNGGVSWNTLNLNGGGLQTGLFYNLSVRPDATGSITVGALQDNEVETTSGGSGLGWVATNGGDGWGVAYDGTIAGQLYATSGFWSPAPCTRMFRSTDDGVSWSEVTPWGTTTDSGCYLAPVVCDPSTGGIVYVGGSQNLWQSQDGAGTWRIIAAIAGAGNASVAPANGNHVVYPVGNQVWLSTNAMAASVGPPTGVTFTNITRNLPSRNVLRAAFDPVDPTVIYAVLGGFDGFGPGQSGHVFRTTIGGSSWVDISPPVNVPCGGLALDGSDTPTTIYVGTDLGVLRSVDLGQSWTVLDDIHFPDAPVTDLIFAPASRTLRAATYGRGVYAFGPPSGPAIAVDLQDNLDFGTVCQGGTAYLTLEVFNVGVADLVITSVARLMGSADVSVMPMPGTPVVVAPGDELSFTVAFTPSTPGQSETATIRILSNDPGSPVLDLVAAGVAGAAALEVAAAGGGNFGEVCLGAFVDRPLVAVNRGTCPLVISGVASSSAAFVPPAVNAYPLTVAPGDALELIVRFQPTARGPASATISIFSNDPAGVKTVNVSGDCPPPRLVLAFPDSGQFGPVCVGSFRDIPLTIADAGSCPLTITGITTSDPEFSVAAVDTYPLLISPGGAIDLVVRYQPVSFGSHAGTITVLSDDPGGPRTLAVSGTAPPPQLRITGTANFGMVSYGQRGYRTLSICNVGPCDLHVSKVAFTPQPRCCDDECGDSRPYREPPNDQRCGDFCLVNNPFPATVRPGSCLPVTILYRPGCCGCCGCCELAIDSDDPETPVKKVLVAGRLRKTLGGAVSCWAASELRKLMDASRPPFR